MKKIILLLLSFLIIGCQKQEIPDLHKESASPSTTIEQVRKGLLALYDATGGERWDKQPNWLTAPSLESFSFVKIEKTYQSEYYKVILDLSDNNLNGELPEAFFEAPLYKVNLSHNRIHGKLPENMGANGLLVEVNLEDNDLEGTLPVSLAESPNVKIDVRNNRMSGKIPEKLQEECVFFSKDFLLDPQQEPFGLDVPKPVPPVEEDVNTLLKIFNELPQAYKTYLYWDHKEPSKWQGVDWSINGRCIGLCLDRYICEMDVFPEEITDLVELRRLKISYISVERLPSLSKLKHLQELYLRLNHLKAFPEGITELTELKFLDLSENEISDPIPEGLNNLTHLRSLRLSDNKFTGKFPDLSGLVKLRVLDMKELSDMDQQPFPDWLSELKDLEILELSQTNLCGDFHAGNINQMKNLKKINFYDNMLTGSVQHAFEGMNMLHIIYLYNNQFSGPLPEFGPDNQIKTLIIDENQFTGEIPASWKYLKGSEYITFSKNKVTGNIPDFMFDLYQLSDFNCSENNMGGVVSDKWKELRYPWHLNPQNGEGFTFPEEN